MYLSKALVKQFHKLMLKFICGSKWKKISRSKFCCNIEDRGAKMIDVKLYFLALKLRWIGKLFNKKQVAFWKIIENTCRLDNLFFAPYAQIVNQVI